MASKSAHILIISVISLVALGIVMLSSTSAFSTDAYADGADLYYDVKRQFFWIGAGVVICFIFAAVDYHWLEKLAIPVFLFSTVLLVLCFIPPVGVNVNGHRAGSVPSFWGLEHCRGSHPNWQKLPQW